MATSDTRVSGLRGRSAAVDPRDQKIEMLSLRNAELEHRVTGILRALRRIQHRLDQLERPMPGASDG